MSSPNLQYVMTLSAPPQKPVTLMGVFDPVTEHPWIFALGILGGALYCATRGKRRR